MNFAYLSLFYAFGVAFLGTAIITPVVIKVMKRYGVLDDPKRHKHPGMILTSPVPRGGSIGMVFGALLASLFFLPLTPIVLSLLFASLLALCIGVLDDFLNAKAKEVSPYLRFLVNILCALIVVGSGVTIPFITNPFGGILHFSQIEIPLILFTFTLGDILAVFWIIWVMNMLNWSKGVDGQMPGIVAISAITIGLVSLRFPLTGHIDGALAFIIAGTCLGFLIYNFYPQRILPGYGATAIYLLLAVISILSSAKLATAMLVMGIPFIDGAFTIFRRLRTRKSIFTGDSGHLHHLLLRLGYSRRQIALFYWTVSAILGGIALTLQSKSKVFAILMLIIILTGVLFFLHSVLRSSSHEKTSS